MKGKTVILIGALALMLSGCSGEVAVDSTAETSEITESIEQVSEVQSTEESEESNESQMQTTEDALLPEIMENVIDEQTKEYSIGRNKDGKEYKILAKSIETSRAYENTIELYDVEELIQTIQWDTMFIDFPVFEDLNLDGYIDMVLYDMESMYNSEHILYTWDAQKSQFEKVLYDGVISRFEIEDGNDMRIINQYRNENGEVQETLQWEGNALVKIDEQYIEDGDVTTEEDIADKEKIQEVTTSNYTLSKSDHTMSTQLKDITDERVTIQFPKFSYNDESAWNNESTQDAINKELELASVGEHIAWLLPQDIRELYEYTVEYDITKATDDVVSVCYVKELYDRSLGAHYAEGITFDPQTGEKISVEEYVTIDEHLLEEVKNGRIRFESLPGYDDEFMMGYLEEFIESYTSGNKDQYSCFYLQDNEINLIIPVTYRNANYFLLKIEEEPES